MVFGRPHRSTKKRIEPAGKDGGHNDGLRGVYTSFFKAWGRLPDEIGRQKPKNVFFLLNQCNDEAEPAKIEDMPRDIQFLYGL